MTKYRFCARAITFQTQSTHLPDYTVSQSRRPQHNTTQHKSSVSLKLHSNHTFCILTSQGMAPFTDCRFSHKISHTALVTCDSFPTFHVFLTRNQFSKPADACTSRNAQWNYQHTTTPCFICNNKYSTTPI